MAWLSGVDDLVKVSELKPLSETKGSGISEETLRAVLKASEEGHTKPGNTILRLTFQSTTINMALTLGLKELVVLGIALGLLNSLSPGLVGLAGLG